MFNCAKINILSPSLSRQSSNARNSTAPCTCPATLWAIIKAVPHPPPAKATPPHPAHLLPPHLLVPLRLTVASPVAARNGTSSCLWRLCQARTACSIIWSRTISEMAPLEPVVVIQGPRRCKHSEQQWAIIGQFCIIMVCNNRSSIVLVVVAYAAVGLSRLCKAPEVMS